MFHNLLQQVGDAIGLLEYKVSILFCKKYLEYSDYLLLTSSAGR